MFVAGKVFRLTEPSSLADLIDRLSDYRVEESFEEGDYKFTLAAFPPTF